VILLQAALIFRLLHEQRLRRHAEVQSRQRMAELAHINRFSTAGELTATIAHEINQPLGAIYTKLELMLKSSPWDVDAIKEIVADVRRDDARASEVIHRLRSLLKKAPFELKDADLNDIVRETVDFLSALTIARQVEMRTSATPASLPILGDRVQLQQVILNLAVNAMDAMANMPVVARKIVISTTRIDNFAEAAISDGGPGIACLPPGALLRLHVQWLVCISANTGFPGCICPSRPDWGRTQQCCLVLRALAFDISGGGAPLCVIEGCKP
jgi:C4-dicarboxylate-specific signal transduction histidine kinase